MSRSRPQRASVPPRPLVRCLLASAAVLAISPSPAVSALIAHRAATCADVTVIGVRGSGETAGRYRGMGQSIEHVALRLRDRFRADGDTVDLLSIDYPSRGVETLTPSKRQAAMLVVGQLPAATLLWYKNNVRKYIASIDDGIAATKATVRTMAGRCPDSDLILAGYSQGAMVIHQAELGLADEGDEDATDAILATVLLGDGDMVPRSRAKRFPVGARAATGVRTYMKGNSSRDVLDPESTVNICAAKDLVCDFNATRLASFDSSKATHTEYLKRKGGALLDTAVDWLANEIIGDEPGDR